MCVCVCVCVCVSHRSIATQLRVGPPLYLVVKDLNVSVDSTDVTAVCGVSGCAVNSLANQVCLCVCVCVARTPFLRIFMRVRCAFNRHKHPYARVCTPVCIH